MGFSHAATQEDLDVCVTDSVAELRTALHRAMPREKHRGIGQRLSRFFIGAVGLPFFRIINALYPLLKLLGFEKIMLHVAKPWIAGTTMHEAIRAVHALEKEGLTYTLDILGEAVHNDETADGALGQYCALIQRLAKECTYRKISVKLSQLGLSISETRCEQRMRTLLDIAVLGEGFVTIDMEQYAYKNSTLHVFMQLLKNYNNVGICLQAYLHDTPRDLHRLMKVAREYNRELHIRLCKGAYVNQEAEVTRKTGVTYPLLSDKAAVDAQFLSLAEEMLGDRDVIYSCFATHDEELILKVLHIAESHRISRKRYEFQQLYGIRHDLSAGLAILGYHTRIYVPFGSHCVPYVIRRLVKNPTNIEWVARMMKR